MTTTNRIPSLCVVAATAMALAASSSIVEARTPLYDVEQQRQLRGNPSPIRSTTVSSSASDEDEHTSRYGRTNRRLKEHDKKPKPSTEESSTTEETLPIRLNRIVGGADVPSNDQHPWFTRVVGPKPDGGLDACGGALIAPDLVLTAAHCTDPTVAYPGRHNLDVPATSVERIGVEQLVRPPEYPGEYKVDYDVMLVLLEEPSDKVPVRMNLDDDYPGVSTGLSMLGFGSVIGGPETGQANPPNQQARTLQTAATQYVPFEVCATSTDPDTGVSYGIGPGRTAVADHWFCTTAPDGLGSTSTCYGDSGGPILKEGFFDDASEDGQTNDLLLAVISGASGYCGNPHLPLWNQRTSFHKKWILETGCALSRSPPPAWGCDNIEALGDEDDLPDNSIYFPVTEAPVVPPTEAPVSPTAAPIDPTDAPVDPTAAPVEPTDAPVEPTDAPVDPTDAPVEPTDAPVDPTAAPVDPTAAPVDPTDAPVDPTAAPDSNIEAEPDTKPPSPTGVPATMAPTVSPTTAVPTPNPTARPTTERPNAFPNPILGGPETEEPEPFSEESPDEDEIFFFCPICRSDSDVILNPSSAIFVPVVGQKTCQEIFDDSAAGKISEGSECDSIRLLALAVCECGPPPDPTDAPVAPTEAPIAPTNAPVAPTEAPVVPTEAPVAPTAAPVVPTIPTEAPVPQPRPSIGVLVPPSPFVAPTVPKPTDPPIATDAPTTSASPTSTPTSSPTVSPTPIPPVRDTCEAIVEANELKDPNLLVEIGIDFHFADLESAKSVGWYLSDPHYQCFRVGVAPGTYTELAVSETLRLVHHAEFLFVLEVDGHVASGSFDLTDGTSTVALTHNLVPGKLWNDEGTFFVTPRVVTPAAVEAEGDDDEAESEAPTAAPEGDDDDESTTTASGEEPDQKEPESRPTPPEGGDDD